MQFQETIGEHGKGGKMMEHEDVAWQWSRMASPRNDIPDTKIPWKELTFFFCIDCHVSFYKPEGFCRLAVEAGDFNQTGQ